MLINRNQALYLIVIFHLGSLCYGQKSSYNFNFRNAELATVIQELSNQSKVNILYNPNILTNNVKINGSYKNLTLRQALDTFLNQTQITYKFYKKDIVLYKKNEEIKESHQEYKSEPQKKNGTDKVVQIITDTVTFTVITYDTVINKVTTYEKVPVLDTVKIYDTIEVVKKVIKSVNDYKPKQDSWAAGLFISQGLLYSDIHLNDPGKDSTGIIKASLREKQGNGFGLNVIYRNKKLMIETGIYLSKTKYTFNHTDLINIGYTTRIDTIDKYYEINGTDTSWIYITEEKPIKVFKEKVYFSNLTYNYVTVPLVVGYNVIRKNFTFEFKGGALLNFYLRSTGSYLNFSSGNELTIENSKAPNSSVSIGTFAGIGIDYYLSKKIHIFGQPSLSWSFLPIGNKATAYYTTDLQVGLYLGLRYYF
jgi:hypothetical protein